jgi:hypothetical protein
MKWWQQWVGQRMNAHLLELVQNLQWKKPACGYMQKNSFVIQESVFDRMVELFKEHGGYLFNAEEKERLNAVMWPMEHFSAGNLSGNTPQGLQNWQQLRARNTLIF